MMIIKARVLKTKILILTKSDKLSLRLKKIGMGGGYIKFIKELKYFAKEYKNKQK